jgi:HD-GYP domain-containing protein (c-di-GMP phosphodiesterase class II)
VVAHSDSPVNKLAVLNEISTALMSELELPHLLELILDRVRTVFDVDRCAILHFDGGTGRLKMLRAVGYDEVVATGFEIEVGEGISGWVASTGMPAVVSDVRKDPRYVPGVTGAVSEVAIPLKRNGEVVGVLDIESTRPLRLEDFDMELATALAAKCAAALYTASLLQDLTESKVQLEQRVRELQVLNHVGKLLGQVLPLDDVLKEILRLAREVLHFKSCAVLLPEGEETKVLRIRAAMGYPEATVGTVRIKKGDGVTGKVFETGIPRLVDDVTKVTGYIPGIIGGRCEMACPLLARGRVLGVLDAEGEEPGCFDEASFVLFSTFASQAAIAIRNAQMLERQQMIYYQTISSLANALEARDAYTRGHSERVTGLAVQIGERLGLKTEEMATIRQAGLLHDIGKIGIPDMVLNKPAALSHEERGELQHHPTFGTNILGQLAFMRQASRAILHHHERFDGNGYPSGLVGAEIPLVARVIAVADAWDAMTSNRPYRDAMHDDKALLEIVENSGHQFDPDVVRAFLMLIGREDMVP